MSGDSSVRCERVIPTLGVGDAYLGILILSRVFRGQRL